MIDANILTIHKPWGLHCLHVLVLVTNAESKIQEHAIRVHKAGSPDQTPRNATNGITKQIHARGPNAPRHVAVGIHKQNVFIAWCIAFNSFHRLSLAHEAKINKITNAHTHWAFRSLTKLKPNMCSCRLTRKTHMEEMPQKSKKFDDLGHNSTSSPCARLMHTRIQAQV